MAPSTNDGSATLTTDTRSAFRTTQESLDQLIQEVRRNSETATEPKAQALSFRLCRRLQRRHRCHRRGWKPDSPPAD